MTPSDALAPRAANSAAMPLSVRPRPIGTIIELQLMTRPAVASAAIVPTPTN